MEFRFGVNEIFKEPIVEISHTLTPPGFSGDRRAYWDTISKVSEVVNAMGEASATAQGLSKPITTAERLRNSEQKIYVLIDQKAGNNRGAVTGMLKTGKKGLYVFDRNGQHFQVSPPCVLDFYVHESKQRMGLGKRLFEHMLQKESIEPVKMAIDRPSEKFLGFLRKHYQLSDPVKQMNNFVVFDGFFPDASGDKGTVIVDHSNDGSRGKSSGKKQSANGLQTSSFITPMGRYGAPRPTCSMGQIIHNQSSMIPNSPEPTGVISVTEKSKSSPSISTPIPQNPDQSQSEAAVNNAATLQQQQDMYQQNMAYATNYQNQLSQNQYMNQQNVANQPQYIPDNSYVQYAQPAQNYSTLPTMQDSNMIYSQPRLAIQNMEPLTPAQPPEQMMNQRDMQQVVQAQSNYPIQYAQSDQMYNTAQNMAQFNNVHNMAYGDGYNAIQNVPSGMQQIPQNVNSVPSQPSQERYVPIQPQSVNASYQQISETQHVNQSAMNNMQQQPYVQKMLQQPNQMINPINATLPNMPSMHNQQHIYKSQEMIQNLPQHNPAVQSDNSMLQNSVPLQKVQQSLSQREINNIPQSMSVQSQQYIPQQKTVAMQNASDPQIAHLHNQQQMPQQTFSQYPVNTNNQNQPQQIMHNNDIQTKTIISQNPITHAISMHKQPIQENNNQQMMPQSQLNGTQNAYNPPQYKQTDQQQNFENSERTAQSTIRNNMAERMPQMVAMTEKRDVYRAPNNRTQSNTRVPQGQETLNNVMNVARGQQLNQQVPQIISQQNMAYTQVPNPVEPKAMNEIENTKNFDQMHYEQGDMGNMLDEHLKNGYPPQVPNNIDVRVSDERASPSSKLERPQFLSIQSGDEEHAEDSLDVNVENEVERKVEKRNVEIVEHYVEPKHAIIEHQAPSAGLERKKTPSNLTEQGFLDLKFYHSKLW